MPSITELLSQLFHFLTSTDAGWTFVGFPFLGCFLAFFFFYLLMEQSRRRKLLLAYTTAFSLFFAFKANGALMLLLPATTVASWWMTRQMALQDTRRKRLAWLWSTIAVTISPLIYFKLSGLMATSTAGLMADNLPARKIFMPIGISFYTFQAISYAADVFRRRFPGSTPLLEYAFYLTFFPLLMAGPITRAEVLIPQAHAPELPTSRNLPYQGLWLILLGIVKKVLIADYIAQYNNWIFDTPDAYSGFECAMGVLGFTLQIYCDFSGYSDMAVGLAALLGFKLCDNFNFPYQSTSLQEFWHRWHISLSTWFRDYVYIPLGGNRKGEWRTYANNLATMIVAGLWHGASGMFAVWGTLHGVGLVVNKYLARHLFCRIRATRLTRAAAWLMTFAYVAFAWIFFRAESTGAAWSLIARVATDFSWADAAPFFLARPLWTAIVLVALELHSIRERDYLWMQQKFVAMPWVVKLIVATIVLQAAINMSGSSVQPFIYSQF